MTRQEYDRLIALNEQFSEVMDFIAMPRSTPIVDNAYTMDYRPVHAWGVGSKEVLRTLDRDLLYIANKIADVYNVSAISGYRGEREQTEYYDAGTGLPWPTSNHNVMPSRALDIVPWPTQYESIENLDMMLGAAQAIAVQAGITIRLGKYFSNRKDYPHIELATI